MTECENFYYSNYATVVMPREKTSVLSPDGPSEMVSQNMTNIRIHLESDWIIINHDC